LSIIAIAYKENDFSPVLPHFAQHSFDFNPIYGKTGSPGAL